MVFLRGVDCTEDVISRAHTFWTVDLWHFQAETSDLVRAGKESLANSF